MGRKPIAGLTGPTGAGKGFVSAELQKHGCAVIDCDAISREIYLPGSRVLEKLCESFSPEILNEDGTLDRKKLAHLAFSDSEKTALLNEITHGEILKVAGTRAMKAVSEGRAAIIDAAALFESGMYKSFDFNIAVLAPLEKRLERVLSRDNISMDSAFERINAQKDDDFYISRADFVIHNYEPYILEEELMPVLRRIDTF